MFSSICALCCERNRQKKHSQERNVKFGGAQAREHSPQSDDDDHSSCSHDHHHKSSSHHQAPPASKSFVQSFIPDALAANSFANEEEQQAAEEKELKRKLKEIKGIAKRLEGPVQKYPRSGKGLFKKMQDRYIAVIPGEDTTPCMDILEGEIASWRVGLLAYWEQPGAYKQGSPPKGYVTLLKIAKVWVSKDDARGRSVIVKHKRGEEMQELVLCFATKRDAEEWSYALWEFISKLRGHSMGSMHFHSGD